MRLMQQKETMKDEALDKYTTFCITPLEHWEKSDPITQNQVFNMMFKERLVYSEKDGYRTPNLTPQYSVCRDLVESNSHLVHPVNKKSNTQKQSKPSLSLEQIYEYLMEWRDILDKP